MTGREIIAATTGAVTSAAFAVGDKPIGITIYTQVDMLESEVITLEVSYNGEDFWQPLWLGDAHTTLSATQTAITATGPAWFRVIKPTTVNNVTVFTIEGR